MIRPELLKRVGVRVVQMIEDNVRKGISSDGRRFAYSTRPFARPLTRSPKNKEFIAQGRLVPYLTKKGKLWAVVPGGYKDWRSMKGLNPDGDFLQDSGEMMRNLAVIGVTDDAAILGFTDEEAAKKAFWLNDVGAGKSRRLMKFLGIRPEQRKELALFVGENLTADDVLAMIRI